MTLIKLYTGTVHPENMEALEVLILCFTEAGTMQLFDKDSLFDAWVDYCEEKGITSADHRAGVLLDMIVDSLEQSDNTDPYAMPKTNLDVVEDLDWILEAEIELPESTPRVLH